MDELEAKGLPKDEIVNIILHESGKLSKTDELTDEDKET